MQSIGGSQGRKYCERENTGNILGKTLALLLVFCLLSLCGCETEDDRIYSELTRSDTKSSVSMGTSEAESAADERFVVSYIEEVLQGELINNRLYNVPVSEILDEYYVNELVTAEECAKAVEDRAWIWLNE